MYENKHIEFTCSISPKKKKWVFTRKYLNIFVLPEKKSRHERARVYFI